MKTIDILWPLFSSVSRFSIMTDGGVRRSGKGIGINRERGRYRGDKQSQLKKIKVQKTTTVKGNLSNHCDSGLSKLMPRQNMDNDLKDYCHGRREMEEDILDGTEPISFDGNASVGDIVNVSASAGVEQKNMKSLIGSISNCKDERGYEAVVKNLSALKVWAKGKKAKETQLNDIVSLFEQSKLEDLDVALHPLQSMDNSLPPQYFIEQKKRIREKQRKGPNKFDQWGNKMAHEMEEEHKWIDNDSPTNELGFVHHYLPPDSCREPCPIAHPSNRTNPPPEFVNSHESFLFIDCIPHSVIMSEENEADKKIKFERYGNPLHRHAVAEYVADLLGVEVTKVFPSTLTSAFVGFGNAKEAANAYTSTDGKRVIFKPVKICLYYHGADDDVDNENDDVNEFMEEAVKGNFCVVKLMDVPSSTTRTVLARSVSSLISQDKKSKISLVLVKEDVLFVKPGTALVRLCSSQTACYLIEDRYAQSTLVNMGTRAINFYPAKRELVHGRYTGATSFLPKKKLSDRIVVDGDIPYGMFFISHGGVLHLANLHPSVTKEDIATFFQPYCMERRDVDGSVQFVSTIDGKLTGRAYVGFDLKSEAIAAWDALGHIVNKGPGNRPMCVRPVKEKTLQEGRGVQERLYRTEKELLESLHTDWEKYVDNADIELLESMSVSRNVLEEAFTVARFQNCSFGVEDVARKGEKIRKGQTSGQHFREFVKLYIETLKEVSTTKDKPRQIFEGIFRKNENNYLSSFEIEKKRLAKLRNEYKW